ncbi:hypothetical protein WJX74_004487 [Apatococcus lobatus]|uniref:Uncharacterized protein n=1 Tax=Apatococcus lobatus TaxID=904363 RepID=A0AAW1SA05_9CHLO
MASHKRKAEQGYQPADRSSANFGEATDSTKRLRTEGPTHYPEPVSAHGLGYGQEAPDEGAGSWQDQLSGPRSSSSHTPQPSNTSISDRSDTSQPFLSPPQQSSRPASEASFLSSYPQLLQAQVTCCFEGASGFWSSTLNLYKMCMSNA